MSDELSGLRLDHERAEALAQQNGNGGPPDPAKYAEELTLMLGLHQVGLDVAGAVIFGEGRTALVHITLSNGQQLEFESMSELTKPTSLIAEVVCRTKAIPSINGREALLIAARVGAFAARQKAMSMADHAMDWGRSYLAGAELLSLEWNDQRQRWAAGLQLSEHERQIQKDDIAGRLVLEDVTTRIRYVRSGWFGRHVRGMHHLSHVQIGQHMVSVGWERFLLHVREPGGKAEDKFRMWRVPPGWSSPGSEGS